MALHHATIAKAEKLGATLTSKDGFVSIKQDDITFHARGANKQNANLLITAIALAMTFKKEYPAMRLTQADNLFTVCHHDGDTQTVIFEEGIDGDKLPDLATLLEKATSLKLDPELGFEEEKPKEVVPRKYKDEYAKRGNRNHCGDWLAKKLHGLFDDEAGNFNHEAFTDFLRLNKVDMTGKWAMLPTSGQKGWAGRYRMNGRQKLEMRLTATGGFLVMNGDEEQWIQAPDAYISDLRLKHPLVEWESE